MLGQTVLTLLSFLIISFALNSTLEQSLFFVSPANWLSYDMYQTAKGIIARSFEPAPNSTQSHDVYSLIDLKTYDVTPILSDIVTACGQGANDFDKLHYHAPTSTLVYYCLNNNSLLILDEQDFTVGSAIATDIDSTFEQVKLVTDGYSIAILGMTGLLSRSPSPTQFIKISLQTKEIVNNITFNHDLREGESVTGYASNGKDLYILTNTVGNDPTMTNNVTVYSMYLISNAYTLTPLASVNNTFSSVLSVFYSVGDLLVTNSNQTLVIMNQKGNILGKVSDITVKPFLPNNIAIVAEYGSSDFYALCDNFILYKFSSKNGGYTKDAFGNRAIDMQFVHGSNNANSLLITTDINYNFTITDLKTSQAIYNTFIMYQNMMLTDSTYASINSNDNPWVLYLYPRKAPFLPEIINVQSEYFYDQKSQILSYLKAAFGGICQLVQVDLKTGDVSVNLTFESTIYSTCPGYLLNVTNNEHGPQAVLDCGDSYLISSQTFGKVNFTAPAMEIDIDTLVVDYDTLTVYHFVATGGKTVNVFAYDYDSKTKSFKLNTTTNNSELYPLAFGIEPGQVLALSNNNFGVIEIPSLHEKIVAMNGPWDTVSPFQDKSGNLYTIFKSFKTYGTVPTIYYDDKFDTIPGSTNATIDAGATGVCTYYVADLSGSFERIRFYSICAEQNLEAY